MLSRGRAVARVWAGGAIAAVLFAVAVVAISPGAVAATPGQCEVFDPNHGTVVWTCTKEGDKRPGGRDENTGTGTESKPSCDLTGEATFCMGTSACYLKDNVVPYAPPKSAPPKPDAQWVVRVCTSADGSTSGEAIWVDDDLPVEPPLIVQARQAVGRLDLPEPRISTNPPRMSVVNLETRFAPDGVLAERRGSSAFGLVAIATPQRWLLGFGDGAARSCALPVTDSCAHRYARASVGQPKRDAAGRPAYEVSARVRWSIRYEVDGVPVTIEDAPATVTGEASTVLLPVAEIQSVVTGGG